MSKLQDGFSAKNIASHILVSLYIEITVILLISIAILLPTIIGLQSEGIVVTLGEVIRVSPISFFIIAALILLPIIYFSIYGVFPTQALRNSIRKKQKVIDADFNVNGGNLSADEKVINYIETLVENSRLLAESIFGRASLYLFIGLFIAISGLMFFYITTISSSTKITSNTLNYSYLVSMLPKFGILFFIEFLAFFFLKQYRTLMDEFRYYEGLKRSREETFAIVKLSMLSDEKIHLYDLIEKCGFRSHTEKLEAGQTLDILESKKNNKDEMEILSKILDVISKRDN